MLQFGTCIIILRRIWVLLILGAILMFGVYLNITYFFYTKQTLTEFNSKEDEVLNKFYDSSHTNLTWDEMIKDCGAQVMIENSARANEIFAKKYLKNTVVWKGYYLNAFFETPNPWGYSNDHILNINVRMIPSESMIHPDLYL
jgi:hypothetical protein